jgi:thioredoxin 1
MTTEPFTLIISMLGKMTQAKFNMRRLEQAFLLAGALATLSCANTSGPNRRSAGQVDRFERKDTAIVEGVSNDNPQIYFIELGSMNCIPCRQMQPVMKSIEAKYSPRVKVIFYDVWTPEQSKYARLYNIRVIPTQVFINESGKEIFRHEGFFPQKDLEEFLAKLGVKPAQSK